MTYIYKDGYGYMDGEILFLTPIPAHLLSDQ